MGTKLEELHPAIYPWARWLLAHWPHHQVTSVYRTRTQQAKLYRRYLAGQMPYPVLPPGRSLHQRRQAFDVITQPMSVLAQLGAIWQRYGGRWGGPRDPVHFEAGPRI